MAYAALVSIAETIDQFLSDGHYSISDDSKHLIVAFHEYVIFLQAFLENFSEKANSMEGRIRDAANEAEDVIEYFILEENHPFDDMNLEQSRLGLYIQLEKGAEKIESIAEQAMDIKNSFKDNRVQLGDDFPETTSTSKLAPTNKYGDAMIGFDDDLMAVKSRLRGESSRLGILPILGMGGIGKTTLARNAYDDPLIKEYFDIRAWVTVSQDYSAPEIVSSLLVSMEGFNAERSGESNEEKVYRSLKGRRYLIVMDDMWSTKAWDDVRNMFPDDNMGSQILLTTRLFDVASYPDPFSSVYEMGFMDEDRSWDLLRHKVFAHQDCPAELETVGKEIAKCCRGLPLAIVVTAGLLSTVRKNPSSWGHVAKQLSSVFAAKDGRFDEILSLSYTNLPHHLRPCFLYMGGFPEDHEIRVSKLIRLWAAEGFLQANGCKSIEEEGEEHLENLVKRSLVFVTKRKSNGKIKSCSLHDLMRDLCIRRAKEEKFFLNIKDGRVGNWFLNPRRVSVASPDSILFPSTIDGSTIHTIIWFIYKALPSLESFRLLRVLDTGDADTMYVPDQLFSLIHLRYLAMNYPGRIPAAISMLRNLQTLMIRARGQWKLDATYSDCLPQEIWEMSQLRHLVFYGTLPDPEGATSTLGNLQTLYFSLSGYSTEETLKILPNVKNLKISSFESPRYWTYGVLLLNLARLHQLESLELVSYDGFTFWQKDYFTVPRMLKKLTLSYLRLSWEDMTAICSLPNLQVLKLKDHACRDSTWETTEGEFPKLEYLLLEKSHLEHWITEGSHFPRLKCLLLHDCWRLDEIPDGIGEIPTLELIEVKGHNKKSLAESAKNIQEEQQNWGNDALRVHCMTH